MTKWCEQVTVAGAVPEVMRRAFAQLRAGRPRPVLVEIPVDVFTEDIGASLDYSPSVAARSAPDPGAVKEVAEVLLGAQRPLLYVGQGVHYARAWRVLRELAELLVIPVTTSLQGKSEFPENHPLSLGSGGRSFPAAVGRFLEDADVVFGIGCSFAKTAYGLAIPPGKTVIHATLDPGDLDKDVRVSHALLGDAGLIIEALLAEVRQRLDGNSVEGREMFRPVSPS